MSIEPYHVTWHEASSGAPSASTHAGAAPTHAVRLRDGSHLELPIRPLPGGERAIALLMSNQTSFDVEQRLAERLIGMVRPLDAGMIVGVPTMGLDYARAVARGIGLPHYVALGLSHKFWYDRAWSEPVVSSTSPGQAKSVFLDPALLARVRGRRVVIVDDVINTGATAVAALRLLSRAGADVVALAAVLTEGDAWRAALAAVNPGHTPQVHALGHIPMFERSAHGWQPC
jgi:adenine/guanine phosphoribosyltransferase-like PRPP-binding protein